MRRGWLGTTTWVAPLREGRPTPANGAGVGLPSLRFAPLIGVAFAVASPASANLGDPSASLASRPLDPGSPTQAEAQRASLPSPESPEDRLLPEPSDVGPGDVQLFPRIPLARAAGWFIPPEPTPSSDEERGEAALEAYLDETLARDRLDAGMVDPWFHAAGREMAREFRPDRNAVERERRAGMTDLQVAYDELRRYAAPRDRPMDVPGQTLPERRGAVTDPTDRRQAVEQEFFDWCNPLNAPVTWYRVDLRVTHNPEGELSAVWVLRSSGILALDQAALQAVREGGVSLPAPPAAVVGERQAIRSDWSFEMGDVATPPFCMTDPGGGAAQGMCVEHPIHGLQCAILGRGIVRTRLRLLAVVDATHFTPEELRAQRRADPDRPRP